jgi:hypothetical protein
MPVESAEVARHHYRLSDSMDAPHHMDSVGCAGLVDVGSVSSMAARHRDSKGYRIREAFRSSRRPKCTAKGLPIWFSLLSPKTGRFETSP